MIAKTTFNKHSHKHSRVSDYGKLALFAIGLAPELNKYFGVLLNYTRNGLLQCRSEGKQAIARYKSYKKIFLDFLSNRTYPKKTSTIVPILRIVDALIPEKDMSPKSQRIIIALNTVLRLYDAVSLDTSEKDLEAFIDSYVSEKQHCYSMKTFKYHGVQTPFTVLSEPFTVALTLYTKGMDLRFKPKEGSILLTKKGVISSTSVGLDKYKPRHSSSFMPSIVEAPITHVIARNLRFPDQDSTRSYMDVLDLLQSEIGKMSFPEMRAASVETEPAEYADQPLRRLCAFPQHNAGGKTRIVCVADYWTQITLHPIHDKVFEILRHLPSDYTFNHDEGFRQMLHLKELGKPLYCYDLSAATDSFPASYQAHVLSSIFNEKIGTLWYLVMTQVPTQYGYYRIGQPMGLLSSWAVFALSHHSLVYAAAYMAGTNIYREFIQHPNKFYGIVGDDIYIANADVALNYQEIMQNIMKVKINLTKSWVPTDKQLISEFVKRNGYGGMEITAVSPNLVIKSFNDYNSFRQLINKLSSFVSYETVDTSSLVQMYMGCSFGFTKAAINVLSELPSTLMGLHDDSALYTNCEHSVVAILTTLIEWPRLSYKLKFVDNANVNRLNEFNQWASIPVHIPGLKDKDMPLNDYLRYVDQRERENQFSRLLKQGKLQVVIDDLIENGLSLDILDSVRDLRSEADTPFFNQIQSDKVLCKSLCYKIYKAIRKFDKLSTFFEKQEFIKQLALKISSQEETSNVKGEDYFSSLFAALDDESSNESDATKSTSDLQELDVFKDSNF